MVWAQRPRQLMAKYECEPPVSHLVPFFYLCDREGSLHNQEITDLGQSSLVPLCKTAICERGQSQCPRGLRSRSHVPFLDRQKGSDNRRTK